MSDLTLDFCGEIYHPDPAVPFTIGREADVVIDEDNPFLHRQFLSLIHNHDLWWLCNVGSQLSATVSHDAGRVQSWLAPGASMPLVFADTTVWFSAGPTTYDFELRIDSPVLMTVDPEVGGPDAGETTLGRVKLTPDQLLLIVALCEDVLRRGDRGAGAVPQSGVAAARLGWTVTKFNRKLDNVCSKMADVGVRGLHGGPAKLASARKARLVEYALSARIVTVDDLDLLPPLH